MGRRDDAHVPAHQHEPVHGTGHLHIVKMTSTGFPDAKTSSAWVAVAAKRVGMLNELFMVHAFLPEPKQLVHGYRV